MSQTKEQVRNEYPLPSYNYIVDVGGETIAFSQISGLSVAKDTITYKESLTASGQVGPRIVYMPGQIQPVNVTLQKGIVRRKSIPILNDWFAGIESHVVEKKDITVSLCDEKGEALITWKVLNAFPVSFEGPSFDANSNDVAMESLQLMADNVFVEEVQ